MIYLLIQTWFWVLLAFLLGLLIGWLLWRGNSEELDSLQNALDECRHSRKQLADDNATLQAKATSGVEKYKSESKSATSDLQPQTLISSVPDDADIVDDWQPTQLNEPKGEKDDLKQVSGIGPVLEGTLNKLGIYHFRQIASFTPQNIAWVDDHLSFKGRIQRENWVEQAAKLDRGESTDFSKRYEKGQT